MDQFPQSAPNTPQTPRNLHVDEWTFRMVNLMRRAKAGASNFYFIAALSAINSIINVFGGSVTFVVGLATTLIIDGFAVGFAKVSPDMALTIKIFGLALSLGIAGIFALIGYFASKGSRGSFITGMILYALDALIMLAFQDWLAFAFHLFFLWGLWNGFSALNQLRKLNPPTASSDFPQNIGTN